MCYALKNEIDVTQVGKLKMFVGRTLAWFYFNDGAYFILAEQINF